MRSFVEILTISHPYLPTNRINIRRLSARMQLRGRKNWTSIRSQEFSGPRAIPPTVTFPAALATTNDRTWFRRSNATHLLCLNCASFRLRGLSYFAKHIAGQWRACAARDLSHPRLFAVCSTRLRHLSLFCRDQANHRNRL